MAYFGDPMEPMLNHDLLADNVLRLRRPSWPAFASEVFVNPAAGGSRNWNESKNE
jgi:hypothetical protein